MTKQFVITTLNDFLLMKIFEYAYYSVKKVM